MHRAESPAPTVSRLDTIGAITPRSNSSANATGRAAGRTCRCRPFPDLLHDPEAGFARCQSVPRPRRGSAGERRCDQPGRPAPRSPVHDPGGRSAGPDPGPGRLGGAGHDGSAQVRHRRPTGMTRLASSAVRRASAQGTDHRHRLYAVRMEDPEGRVRGSSRATFRLAPSIAEADSGAAVLAPDGLQVDARACAEGGAIAQGHLGLVRHGIDRQSPGRPTGVKAVIGASRRLRRDGLVRAPRARAKRETAKTVNADALALTSPTRWTGASDCRARSTRADRHLVACASPRGMMRVAAGSSIRRSRFRHGTWNTREPSESETKGTRDRRRRAASSAG